MMSGGREIRWKIDAFTRETMPLARLAEYLKEFAGMLGEESFVHLIRVDSSSIVPVLQIDDEASDHVQQRAAEIRMGTAPLAAMLKYRNINRMLREDGGSAVLLDNSAEIIPFPGRKEKEPTLSGVSQQGSLDGTLIKIGGHKDLVPIHLETMDQGTITKCYVKRDLAREMGHYIFDPVRIFGRGKWNRTPEGEWLLDRFAVDSFEPLNDAPLPQVLAELRSIHANWPDDPLAALRSLRHEHGEAD